MVSIHDRSEHSHASFGRLLVNIAGGVRGGRPERLGNVADRARATGTAAKATACDGRSPTGAAAADPVTVATKGSAPAEGPDAPAAEALDKRPGERLHRFQGPATSLLSIALVIGIWWLVAVVVVKDPTVLPTPGAVAHQFWTLATPKSGAVSLWVNLKASLIRVALGWGIGVVSGVMVGVLMASNEPIRALIDPLIELARPIPPLAYVPLLVVWFGIGETSKLILIWAATFPVMVISTVAGIRGVDVSWRRTAVTLGASPLQLVTKVILPAAIPEIVTGARIASGLAWGTLVAAEIIAASSGLGYMILQASQFLETSTIFVGIITIGFLAFVLDWLLRAVERRLAPWKGRL
jgi:taurine transport system permease protein